MPQTLRQACVPRKSVFEQRGMDTVYDLDTLNEIDARKFFAENYVTDGMRQLLTEAFTRLEGRSESAPGAFLLSQSMGGGKTHNLIALGLLAQNPSLRESVMGSFYTPGPLGKVRVVSFTGRNSHTPFGIWGHIAQQLNKKDVLKEFYQPLQPPGTEQWVELLRGEPVLIMLDELPPYFNTAKGVQVGETTLASLTTAALANLLVAVAGSRLPNVCLVMTDLRGAAYEDGSKLMNQALEELEDLEKEANRVVMRIDPVRMNAYELYSILATRIFEQLPEEGVIREVAEAYFKELDEARLMDVTSASPDEYRSNIARTYPFHPAIRDLFGRFKENQGFQQTRALIRIMRLVVAHLWESGAADSQYLVGAQDLDLHSAELMSEMRQINAAFEPAIAHDIAAEGESSVAEQIDGPNGRDAQDVAKLVLLSSLSQAVNPTLGLDRSEIAAYLAAPGRSLDQLRTAIDEVQQKAWFIHPTSAGKLIFKNIENLVAKMENYTQALMREQREDELRKQLASLFKPITGDCYQDVAVLPALDRVTPAQDKVTLLIFRPGAQSLADVQQFFEQQQYKNRVVFLTAGTSATYETALQRAAELYAIRKIVEEMNREGMRADAPQLVEANELAAKKQAQFYQACREAFQALHYPSKQGLTQIELEPRYDANDYKGEEQVRKALADAYKFVDEVSADSTFKTSVENKLWPEGLKEVAWSTIRQRAAADQSWVLHHPRALDDLKTELIRRDQWREHDGYVERGPFEKPPTHAQVQEISRTDEGLAVLRVSALHGDRVYWSTTGPATTADELLDTTKPLETKALRAWFLAVDSTDEHETGEAVLWQNTITVKYRPFQDGDVRRYELKAYPAGSISYTTDGSSPAVSGIAYKEPFAVPKGTRVVLAIAQAEGTKSLELRIDVSDDKRAPEIDPARPAVWTPGKKVSLDDTSALYAWLDQAARFGAKLAGIRLVLAEGQKWIEVNTSPDLAIDVSSIRQQADALRQLLAAGSFNAEVRSVRFESGKDLLTMIAELKLELQPGEVRQP